ncbi:MAG TPA: GIY-YIG nuclease family protein [Sphingobacterium sp.]|nr:GIY-YIG nuclease family protein [Sphingobacterium sp.]
MPKSLDDIFEDDDFGLLDSKPQTNYVQTDEDRLIESFEEINVFYEKHKREPSSDSMSEYALQARLKAFKQNERTKGVLKAFDRNNLLGHVEEAPKSIEDIFENDSLGLLEGGEGDTSIFNFVHTPKPGSRAEAEYIAQRKSMPEHKFKKYEAMFHQVHKELKAGKRKLLPFSDAEKNLLEGNFYLVDGLLCYLEVSDAEETLKKNKSGNRIRIDGRTVTIFENGTISNMLFRSLGKAIQKNGKMITSPIKDSERQLFENAGMPEGNVENFHSGWIYILKSLSTNPEIQNIENLFKIGFSTTPVEDRIKHAQQEPTYLFSEVEIVASYTCENIHIQNLENLLHRFFAEVCLNIDIWDKNNNRITPREWFVVPLKAIDEAVQLLQNQTIFNYKYDKEKESIVLK